MSINLSVPTDTSKTELKPKITVVGVGGAGGNAVNNMIERSLEGVEFVVANTDAQALSLTRAQRTIHLGAHLTQGLGAGSRPEIGRAAAEEALDEVLGELNGSHMVFIAAGMGGGTGTGAAPVIAQAVKKAGALTVGVVTKPFQFEGSHRMKLAEAGIEELAKHVDTLIIIPNQNLFRVANENTTFADAFGMADQVLYSGVRGVTELMVMPGLINLDFADIRTVMSEMGKAMMGTGEATGERRALDAAEAAIANPLLDDSSMKGAKGILINITGGPDITLFEVDEAATRIRDEVDSDAYIIVGSAFDSELNGTMRVSVVATGIDASASAMPKPTVLTLSDPRPIRAPVMLAEQVEAEPEPVIATIEPIAVIEPEPEPELVPEVVEAAVEIEAEVAIETPVLEVKAEIAPAAMPGTAESEPFIPSPPQIAKPVITAPKPDPFAAAAMTNGAHEGVAVEVSQPETQAGSRPSLFERVTRSGKAALNLGAPVSEEPSPEPKPQPAITEVTQLSEQVALPPKPQPVQAILETVETASEEVAESDDDLLDIPSFLRRQAN